MRPIISLGFLFAFSGGLCAQVFPGFGSDTPASTAQTESRHRQEVRGYYPSGALHYVVRYRRGLADGIAREYYENGILKAEVRFQNGRRDGIAKYYYENGLLKAKIFFNRDREVGRNKFYGEDGRPVRMTDVSLKVQSIVEKMRKQISPPTLPDPTPKDTAPDRTGK